MAHVEKRGQGRWRARYRAPDGRELSKTFDTRRDADRWLATVETAKIRGDWVAPELGKTTFGAYAPTWLATKAAVSARTLINVEGRLRNHATPFFGEMPLAAIRPSHVRAWVADLTASGLAPATVKGAYLTASQVFRAAEVDRLIARTPCVGIEMPRDRNRSEMRFLSAAEVAALADAIDDRYRPLIYTAAYAGMRAGEIGALKVDRLNVLSGTVSVVAAVSEVRGELVTGPTKTGRPRALTVPRFLAEMLGEHIGRYPSEAGFVFTAGEGGQVRHRNFVRRHFQPACVAAGLGEMVQAEGATKARFEGLRFHDLRHTCAALLLSNGRNLHEVKDYLGHSSIRVTSDRYGHLLPEAREALANVLDGVYREAPAACPRPEGSMSAIRAGSGAGGNRL